MADSKEQQKAQAKRPDSQKSEQQRGYGDKKLNGPNRPAE